MGDAGPGKAGADFDGKKAMKKAKKPGGRLDQYPEQQFIMRVSLDIFIGALPT